MQMVVQNLLSEMETMEEMAAIFKRFGDEQSTLLDKYERLSFEVQLNRAMLGRSLSEPAVSRRQAEGKVAVMPAKDGGRSRGSGFQKVVRKLFGPIMGRKGGRKNGAPNPDPKDTMSWKTFGRSLRV